MTHFKALLEKQQQEKKEKEDKEKEKLHEETHKKTVKTEHKKPHLDSHSSDERGFEQDHSHYNHHEERGKGNRGSRYYYFIL